MLNDRKSKRQTRELKMYSYFSNIWYIKNALPRATGVSLVTVVGRLEVKTEFHRQAAVDGAVGLK